MSQIRKGQRGAHALSIHLVSHWKKGSWRDWDFVSWQWVLLMVEFVRDCVWWIEDGDFRTKGWTISGLSQRFITAKFTIGATAVRSGNETGKEEVELCGTPHAEAHGSATKEMCVGLPEVLKNESLGPTVGHSLTYHLRNLMVTGGSWRFHFGTRNRTPHCVRLLVWVGCQALQSVTNKVTPLACTRSSPRMWGPRLLLGNKHCLWLRWSTTSGLFCFATDQVRRTIVPIQSIRTTTESHAGPALAERMANVLWVSGACATFSYSICPCLSPFL